MVTTPIRADSDPYQVDDHVVTIAKPRRTGRSPILCSWNPRTDSTKSSAKAPRTCSRMVRVHIVIPSRIRGYLPAASRRPRIALAISYGNESQYDRRHTRKCQRVGERQRCLRTNGHSDRRVRTGTPADDGRLAVRTTSLLRRTGGDERKALAARKPPCTSRDFVEVAPARWPTCDRWCDTSSSFGGGPALCPRSRSSRLATARAQTKLPDRRRHEQTGQPDLASPAREPLSVGRPPIGAPEPWGLDRAPSSWPNLLT